MNAHECKALPQALEARFEQQGHRHEGMSPPGRPKVELRALGGALLADRWFGWAFIDQKGAQSYFAGRGFRGLPRV